MQLFEQWGARAQAHRYSFLCHQRFTSFGAFVFKECPRLCYDILSQSQKCDQIGEGHEGVCNIGQGPDRLQSEEGRYGQHEKIDDLVDQNTLGAVHQVDQTPFSVIAPSDDGGEGEESDTDGYNVLPHVTGKSQAKGLAGQNTAVQATASKKSRGQDHKAGHGADHDGGEKDTGHGNQPLSDAGIGLCRGRYDRRAAKACLVGVDASGNTGSHGRDNRNHHNARHTTHHPPLP